SRANSKAKKVSNWDLPPQRFEFVEEKQIQVGDWRGVEQSGHVQKPKAAEACHFYRLPALVPSVQSISKYLLQNPDLFSTELDSVDKTPTFEFYPFRDGEWIDQGMRHLLEEILDRVMVYVRLRYDGRCAASDILVRRYLPGERRSHGVHFDGHALVTAVLGLTDPETYQGGLYVQPGPDVTSRTYFRLEPGDLLVHSFDLQHGVHVWEGARYSIVFWIKDSAQAVRDRSTPWYRRLEEQGDADVLFNLAQNFEHGLFGEPVDLAKALELYELSAGKGHHFAQNNLGLIYRRLHESSGEEQLLRKSVHWLKAAAEAGFAMAQKNLALAAAPNRSAEWEIHILCCKLFILNTSSPHTMALSGRRVAQRSLALAVFAAGLAFAAPRRAALATAAAAAANFLCRTCGRVYSTVGSPAFGLQVPFAAVVLLKGETGGLLRKMRHYSRAPSALFRRPGAREELEDAEEALSRVIEDFQQGASSQDVARVRMARAQARIAINDSTGGKLPAKAEEAVQDYTEVVKLMEADASSEGTFDYPNVFVRRALAQEEIAYGRKDLKQWEAAAKDYSKAIDTWRSRPVSETGLGVNPLVLNFRGNCYSQLGLYREALADYREATEIFLKDNEYSQAALSRCNEALALFGADEASEAVSIMEDVSRRDPNIADARIALAASYWASGDYVSAEDQWLDSQRVRQQGMGLLSPWRSKGNEASTGNGGPIDFSGMAVSQRSQGGDPKRVHESDIVKIPSEYMVQSRWPTLRCSSADELLKGAASTKRCPLLGGRL
ncbi:unnamed protein product, partial [Effrenium voratum]